MGAYFIPLDGMGFRVREDGAICLLDDVYVFGHRGMRKIGRKSEVLDEEIESILNTKRIFGKSTIPKVSLYL